MRRSVRNSAILSAVCVAAALTVQSPSYAEGPAKQQDDIAKEFLDGLGKIIEMGEEASKAQGPETHKAFMQLKQQIDESSSPKKDAVQAGAVAQKTPGSGTPSPLEDPEQLFKPLVGNLMGFAVSSTEGLSAVAAAQQRDQANKLAGAAKLQGASSPSLVGKATLLDLGGRFAEAAAVYREAIAADPENAAAFYGLSVVLAKQNSKDESLAALGKAVAFDKKYADIASREAAFDQYRQDSVFAKMTQR